MNREILFRGKRLDNAGWVYGLLTIMWGSYHIIDLEDENTAYPVDIATVGQYTGLTDKNGVRVFEGDIISYGGSREVVRFDTSLRIPCFTTGIGRGSSTTPHPYKISSRHVVLGNIHDNPELLKGGAV